MLRLWNVVALVLMGTVAASATPLLLPSERAALLPGRAGSWQARGRTDSDGAGGCAGELDGYDVSQGAAMMVQTRSKSSLFFFLTLL